MNVEFVVDIVSSCFDSFRCQRWQQQSIITL